MKVIGIAGRASSGKDPAAFLVAGAQHGRTKIIRLATGLKKMMGGLYGIPYDDPLFETKEGKEQPSPAPLKPGNTVRDDLLDLGDKTRALYLDVWVEDALRRAREFDLEFLVIPDVRYENELAVCDELIWIGPETPGNHACEQTLFKRHATEGWVFDSGSVAGDLKLLVDKLYN